MWFNKLMGFYEKDPQQVNASIEIKNDKLISKINQAVHIHMVNLKFLLWKN